MSVRQVWNGSAWVAIEEDAGEQRGVIEVPTPAPLEVPPPELEQPAPAPLEQLAASVRELQRAGVSADEIVNVVIDTLEPPPAESTVG